MTDEQPQTEQEEQSLHPDDVAHHCGTDENPLDHVGDSAPTHDPFTDYPQQETPPDAEGDR